MIFNRPITHIIEERTSWRTFANKLLENNLKLQIKNFLNLKEYKSPFGNEGCRFELIGTPDFDPSEEYKIGTYGMIKGAQEFIVGATKKSDFDKENYGYLLEIIILYATDLGLGTCWLGGTFNRTFFSNKIQCKSDEIVPAITPIGYQSDKRRLKEKVIRSIVKAKQRLPWEELFFRDDFNTPLNRYQAGLYERPLEMVRIGPSAGNKQPWRILNESNQNVYHFYVKYSDSKKLIGYNNFVRLDIGIAVCHFDLTVKELGLKGKWEFLNPNISTPEELKYTISWIGE